MKAAPAAVLTALPRGAASRSRSTRAAPAPAPSRPGVALATAPSGAEQATAELDWSDLRIFLAVHEAGTLAAAARALGVDQSTVSRRLSALESALDAHLFARTPAGLRLTEVGASVVEPAHEVRRGVKHLARRAHAARGTGPVRLTTTEIVATGPLFDHLRRFQDRHPEIALEVRVGEETAGVLHHDADISLRLLAPGDAPGRPSEVARRLVTVAFALYASPAYLERRGEVTSLDEHEVIVYSAASTHRPGAEFLASHAPRARHALTCDGVTAALSAAAQGFGVGVLPCGLADPDPRLRRLGEAVDFRQLWLVAHPDLRNVPRIRAVLDAIASVVEQDRDLLEGARGEPAEPRRAVAL